MRVAISLLARRALGHAKDVGGCPAERPELRSGTRKAPILPQSSQVFFRTALASVQQSEPAGPLDLAIAAHRAISSSNSNNSSSINSTNGNNKLVHFVVSSTRAWHFRGGETQQVKLRVGHVHLTVNEVVPLRNTNRFYAWLVRAAVASHS